MKKGKPRRGHRATTAPSAGTPLQAAPKTLIIPPILLEGDDPSPHSSTSDQGSALIPRQTAPTEVPKTNQLPEAYGTAQLLLMPKDPHSLFAHWDFTSAQQRAYRELAPERKLVLRVRRGTATGVIASELPLEAEARHCFVYVPTAGAGYVAQLGYYDSQEHFVAISNSGPVTTPHESASSDKALQFSLMQPSPARRRRVEPKITEGSSTPLMPPRVGWLPSLGIVPDMSGSEMTKPFSSMGEFAATKYVGSAALPPQEWTTEQELALETMLAACSLRDSLSSYNLATEGTSLEIVIDS